MPWTFTPQSGLRTASHTQDAILVLGGEPERDSYAVELALDSHRGALATGKMVATSPGSLRRAPLVQAPLVFVSSPAAGAEIRLRSLADAGLLRLSWDAIDTLSNFSTVLPAMLACGIRRVRIVTAAYHMPRALAIARWTLGSAGIDFEPCIVPGLASLRPTESRWKIWRDSLRAIVWRYTGWELRWLVKRLIRVRDDAILV